MRLMMLMLVAALAAGPAAARNEKRITEFASALFGHMAASWLCRDQLGIATYEGSKRLAVNGLAMYVTRPEAQQYVDRKDRSFREDTRVFAKPTLDSCNKQQKETLRLIEVERAKLLE